MKAREIEKMTIVKLREECLKIPNIVGVHGMTKDQLIAELKEFNDIPVEEPKKVKRSIKSLKNAIIEMRKELDKALEANDKSRVTYLRRRISGMKKKTRGV